MGGAAAIECAGRLLATHGSTPHGPTAAGRPEGQPEPEGGGGDAAGADGGGAGAGGAGGACDGGGGGGGVNLAGVLTLASQAAGLYKVGNGRGRLNSVRLSVQVRSCCRSVCRGVAMASSGVSRLLCQLHSQQSRHAVCLCQLLFVAAMPIAGCPLLRPSGRPGSRWSVRTEQPTAACDRLLPSLQPPPFASVSSLLLNILPQHSGRAQTTLPRVAATRTRPA